MLLLLLFVPSRCSCWILGPFQVFATVNGAGGSFLAHISRCMCECPQGHAARGRTLSALSGVALLPSSWDPLLARGLAVSRGALRVLLAAAALCPVGSAWYQHQLATC